MRARAGASSASCRIPAMNTPQARATIGTSRCGASNNAAAIMDTFSKTGANEGKANLPKVLRMLPA